MEMNELKPKKKAESQKLEKQLQTGVIKTIKTLTSKLVSDNDILTKKIEKWSKKLAKKVAKEVKANQPAVIVNEPAVKVAEKEKPVVKEQTAAPITPAVKQKSVAVAGK